MFNLFKRKDNFLITDNFIEIEENFDHQHLNLAIWQRSPNDEILRYIKFLQVTEFTSFSYALSAKSLVKEVEDMFLTKIPQFPFIKNDSLKEDVILLTQYYIKLSGKQKLNLHLKLVNNYASRKFHVDGYESRLLCTYERARTEWLENRNVKRSALGSENNKIVKNWKAIRQMKPFEVGFLKGENLRYPNGKGIVYRSPPIEATGKKRFLLRIDAL